MHTRTTAEVYGLFAPLLPQAARDEFTAQPVRQRQGIVPDLLIQCRIRPEGPLQDVLWELKTLHYGSSTYPQSEERCRAVSKRAAAINAEYVAKVKRLDADYFSDPANGGPANVAASTRHGSST